MGSVPIATLTTHTTQQLTIRTDTLAVIQLKCKPAREIRVMLLGVIQNLCKQNSEHFGPPTYP